MQTLPLDHYRDFFTEIGYNKLSISLSRIEKGNSNVLITPQAKRIGPYKILEAWNKEFSSHLDIINDDLLELEMSNKSKFGPRSIAKPWTEIRQSALESFEIPRVNCDHLKSLPPTSANIGILRPTSLANSSKLTRSNTQAGAPTLELKGEVRDFTYKNFDKLYNQRLPMCPAIRTQEQGKTRLVNIVDYATIMQENRYFLPLFNLLREEFCFSGFKGPDAVDSAMTKLIHEAVESGRLCISGDIEGFDSSVGKDLQNSAFTEFKSYFQSQYNSEIDEIANRFLTLPFVTPDGVWVGEHGIPSGSNLTGIIGSMVNRQVSQHPSELSQFLGDDFALVAKTSDEVFSKYSGCGLKLNETKTLVKPYGFVYLQKLHHADYVVDGEYKGIYPTFRGLNRLCFPEYFSYFNDYDLDGKSYFAIRSLSILENSKYHPLFEEYVKFWMRYDKYIVPSNSSIRSFAKMTEEKLGSVGTTNQYGDKISGIRSFKSYQLAVSLL